MIRFAFCLCLSLGGFSSTLDFPPSATIPVDLNFAQSGYYAVKFDAGKFVAAFHQAEKQAGPGVKLLSRGEAHLTLLTPPEFQRLSESERQKLLVELQGLDWSKPQIKLLCLGRGEVPLNGKPESAYFVVAEAPGIQKIREKFGLKVFYPHVTVGFTRRDLHFEDGVIKDRSTCI